MNICDYKHNEVDVGYVCRDIQTEILVPDIEVSLDTGISRLLEIVEYLDPYAEPEDERILDYDEIKASCVFLTTILAKLQHARLPEKLVKETSYYEILQDISYNIVTNPTVILTDEEFIKQFTLLEISITPVGFDIFKINNVNISSIRSMVRTLYFHLGTVQKDICHTLPAHVIRADTIYNSSWKARGGPGAWFSLVRKYDRIINWSKKENKTFADCIMDTFGLEKESMFEDIKDLCGYFLLVLTEIHYLGELSRSEV